MTDSTSRLKICVTGGIGTGKSTVCRVFELLGVPVYRSDERAKLLMTSDATIIAGLKQLFGTETYHPDGTIDKTRLANIIFSNEQHRHALQAVVHPAVWIDFEKWCENQHGHDYVIQESALIYENNWQDRFDYILTTTCPAAEKLARVVKRDNCNEQQALQRINSQMGDEEKATRSHFVIDTGKTSRIIQHIIDINEKLIKKRA